jgi:UDP-glucose 4-epimerase
MLAANASDVSGLTFNIACGERISLNRLLSDLREILGVDIQASYTESRPGDVKHSLADISKAREKLGYSPVVDFSEGVRHTVAYLSDRSEASRPSSLDAA